MVGNQVTDLPREVNFRRKEEEVQYFQPLHIQYIPLRKQVLDIIETLVAETTCDLARFGEGNTIVNGYIRVHMNVLPFVFTKEFFLYLVWFPDSLY